MHFAVYDRMQKNIDVAMEKVVRAGTQRPIGFHAAKLTHCNYKVGEGY